MVIGHQGAHASQSGRVISVSWGATRVPSRTVNQKVLPCPGVLSTPIVPPMAAVRRWEMARPKPVPPYFRVVESSAWENAWNRRPWASGAMPMPVSVTVKRSSVVSAVASSRVVRTTTSPCAVNFTALPTRLVRI